MIGNPFVTSIIKPPVEIFIYQIINTGEIDGNVLTITEYKFVHQVIIFIRKNIIMLSQR